jgi:hypothetical protein
MANKLTAGPCPAGRVSARRYRFTPELLAHGRHRYENTPDSLPDIAVEFGIHKSTLLRLAQREGWVRYAIPPRDLSPATRLAEQADALAGQLPPPESGRVGEGDVDSSSSPISPPPPPGDDGNAAEPSDVDRIERAVRAELSVIEDMRARMRHRPQSPLDAERTARTLSSLTATLFKLQRLRCGLPEETAYDDDMPADIDAFRDALARRIRAFFAARRGPAGAAEGPAPAGIESADA